jgi:hypothetical protein
MSKNNKRPYMHDALKLVRVWSRAVRVVARRWERRGRGCDTR